MSAYEKVHMWGYVKPTYRGFIAWAGLYGSKTPDGYKYDSQKIDYKALTDMIREF